MPPTTAELIRLALLLSEALQARCEQTHYQDQSTTAAFSAAYSCHQALLDVVSEEVPTLTPGPEGAHCWL